MSENITTVNNMTRATTLSGSDLLYLIQGSGSDRDKALELDILKDWMMDFTDEEAVFDSAEGGTSIHISNEGFTFYGSNGTTIDDNGLTVGNRSGSTKIKGPEITTSTVKSKNGFVFGENNEATVSYSSNNVVFDKFISPVGVRIKTSSNTLYLDESYISFSGSNGNANLAGGELILSRSGISSWYSYNSAKTPKLLLKSATNGGADSEIYGDNGEAVFNCCSRFKSGKDSYFENSMRFIQSSRQIYANYYNVTDSAVNLETDSRFTTGFEVGSELRIVNSGSSNVTVKYGSFTSGGVTSQYSFTLYPNTYCTFMRLIGSNGTHWFASSDKS